MITFKFSPVASKLEALRSEVVCSYNQTRQWFTDQVQRSLSDDDAILDVECASAPFRLRHKCARFCFSSDANNFYLEIFFRSAAKQQWYELEEVLWSFTDLLVHPNEHEVILSTLPEANITLATLLMGDRVYVYEA